MAAIHKISDAHQLTRNPRPAQRSATAASRRGGRSGHCEAPGVVIEILCVSRWKGCSDRGNMTTVCQSVTTNACQPVTQVTRYAMLSPYPLG